MEAISRSTHTLRPKPVEGRHFLLRHPSSETQVLEHLWVQVARAKDRLRLRFTATGDVEEISLPPIREPARADQLWQHTCFEAFVRHSGNCYWEFNFSPSSHWAGYAFTGYRTDMSPLALAQPAVIVCKRERTLRMDVELLLPAHLAWGDLNLAAVIEEKSGHKSYWALAHPPEGPPDFHDPACFVLELPPK